MKFTNQAKSGRKAMPAILRDRRSRIPAERARRPAAGHPAGGHPAGTAGARGGPPGPRRSGR